MVVARGKNAQNQRRFFRINFQDTTFNTNTWSQIVASNTYPIDSDPGLEWNDDEQTLTLYYRSNEQIIQTSGLNGQLGTLPFTPVSGSSGHEFTGAPQAIGNTRIEFGSHAVIARGTDGVAYVAESDSSDWLTP